MKTVYVAVYELEEEFEVLGVFVNRTDAEEWCMQDCNDILHRNFNYNVNIYNDTIKEAMLGLDESWIMYGYKVREVVCFD